MAALTQAAPALLDGLPVLWICVDTAARRLVHWHPAFAAWLGWTSEALAERVRAGWMPVPDAGVLTQPLHETGVVERTLACRHANGEPRPCTGLGTAAAGALPPGWVLWTLLPQATAADPGVPFDWALEAERQRREAGARLLHALAAPLEALLRGMAADTPPPRDVMLRVLEQARATAERGAALLAAPAQRASDLLQALHALVDAVQARSGVRCSVICDDPALADMRLSDAAKLAGYRAIKALLEHFTAEWRGEPLELRLETVAACRLRCGLSVPGTSTQTVLDRVLPAGTGCGLGLFAMQAAVAGVGGRLVIAPGLPPGLLAALELPLAG